MIGAMVCSCGYHTIPYHGVCYHRRNRIRTACGVPHGMVAAVPWYASSRGLIMPTFSYVHVYAKPDWKGRPKTKQKGEALPPRIAQLVLATQHRTITEPSAHQGAPWRHTVGMV